MSLFSGFRVTSLGARGLGFAAVVLILVSLASTARAYDFLGSTWPSGNIPMRLQLDATATAVTFPLSDGSTSWNSVAQSAIAEWNAKMSRSQMTSTTSTATSGMKYGDGINQVFFSTTIYGDAFDSRTLAVTLVDQGDQTIRSDEADLIVNKTRSWNSYRGTLRTAIDLRRVILHELGHVIGLTHPDEAGQNVVAIMNSTITNTIETLQPDDIAGVTYYYSTPFSKPTITTQPTNQTAGVSGAAKFTISVDGQDPPAADDFHSYHWYFKAAGATDYEPLFTLIKPGSLNFGSVQAEDAGSYYFVAITPDSTVTSNTVTLTTSPATVAPSTQLANLSTRGIGGNSARVMTVGFVVTGTRNKSVLLRAAGPGLAGFGVSGTLADPQLVLKIQSTGATIATSAAIWDQSTNATDIKTVSPRVGAFALAAGSRDAVILTSLAPGSYTMSTASPSGATGTVLIEAYDADEVRDTASRLANLSTRGYVSTGADTLIAGFVVQGPGPRTYLIRVAGDTLQSFGVTGTLDDPFLKLFTGSTLIREKDDWDSPLTSQPALKAAFTQVGAFTFSDRQEPAMLVTLAPGSYTAQATGLDNGGSTSPVGNALIEIYEIP